jgi:hypothetical protein
MGPYMSGCSMTLCRNCVVGDFFLAGGISGVKLKGEKGNQ